MQWHDDRKANTQHLLDEMRDVREEEEEKGLGKVASERNISIR